MGTRDPPYFFTHPVTGPHTPYLFSQVLDHFDCVGGSYAPILNPTTTLLAEDNRLQANVFEVLVTTFDLSRNLDGQLKRSKWGLVVNSTFVKEIEYERDTLKQMVISVVLQN